MFAFFRKPRSKRSTKARAARRFRLETLESRNCPSAVGLSFDAQTADGHNVSVQGQVMGSESSYQVTLSGPVSASLSVGSAGTFSYLGPATGLGMITATVTDSDGDTSQSSADVMDSPPQISGLMVEATGQGKQVDVSGSVSALAPASLPVALSGSAGLAATAATTDANGNFNLLTTAANLGDVTAIVTDVWGTDSSPSTTSVMVMQPQISGFSAINLGNGKWQFQGTVSGPDAADDTVQLSGVGSAQVTPDASGNFSVVLYVGSNPSGDEYAVATDIWGQTSNQASYMFF